MPHIVRLSAATFGLGVLFLLAVVEAHASVVVVDPAHMGNWAFANSDVNGTVGNNPTATTSMTVGPGAPPVGTGSARLATGNGAVGGDGAAILSNSGYAGILLSSITSLSYWTYDTANNGQQFPYLQLEVLTGNTYDQLFFEPPYQTPVSGNPSLPNQGSTVLDTWQSWNALTGGWWDNNGSCGSPGSGVVSLASCINSLGATTTIVNNFGTAGVFTGVGGLQFDVGFANPNNTFNGYV